MSQQQQQQQQGNQQSNPQTQAQANLQQMTQAQRQQQLQMVQQQQQQQIESNIKQTQPNNPIQNNPMQTQGQAINQTQAMSQMGGGQQQWNFQNQMNQMQGTSGQNQPANTAQPQPQPQPQQFFNQGVNRFERPQMNNPTSKQALSMMLRQRHPTSFMNAAANPQQPSMSGLPFNIQQQRQQQLLRTAAMRNVNPAQLQAANANQLNANSLGNPMMSGGGMVQQRQVKYLLIKILIPARDNSLTFSPFFISKQQQASQINPTMQGAMHSQANQQPQSQQTGMMAGK